MYSVWQQTVELEQIIAHMANDAPESNSWQLEGKEKKATCINIRIYGQTYTL